jgi:hypothetical protein
MSNRLQKITMCIFVPLLVACGQAEEKPIPTPTQYLSPATDYVAGLSEIPPDNIIFVLLKDENSGTGGCNFPPAAEQAPLAFRYSSNTLDISSSGSSGWLSDRTLMDVNGQEIIGLGFFGYITSNDWSLGGNVHDEIYYIDKLPFEIQSLSIIVYSVLSDGTIIASVKGQVYQFRPNQSWLQTSSSEYEGQPGCHTTNASSLTNIGLMNRNNVRFVDEVILP